MDCGFVGSVPVVAVETGSSFPFVVVSNLNTCMSLLPPLPFEPELITATNFLELSFTSAIGNSPPDAKGDPAIPVSCPEAAVRVKALMLLLHLLAT